jgi:hypothetical protein
VPLIIDAFYDQSIAILNRRITDPAYGRELAAHSYVTVPSHRYTDPTHYLPLPGNPPDIVRTLVPGVVHI